MTVLLSGNKCRALENFRDTQNNKCKFRGASKNTHQALFNFLPISFPGSGSPTPNSSKAIHSPAGNYWKIQPKSILLLVPHSLRSLLMKKWGRPPPPPPPLPHNILTKIRTHAKCGTEDKKKTRAHRHQLTLDSPRAARLCVRGRCARAFAACNGERDTEPGERERVPPRRPTLRNPARAGGWRERERERAREVGRIVVPAGARAGSELLSTLSPRRARARAFVNRSRGGRGVRRRRRQQRQLARDKFIGGILGACY